MAPVLKILLLEDNPADADLVQLCLHKEKMDCIFHIASDKTGFIDALDHFSPDLILSDHSLPQFNSFDALSAARQRFPNIPFIMVTGTASEEFATHIIKQGADDYILKDRMARLPAAIKASLLQRRSLKEVADYKYALDQTAIVAITDQRGIIQYANDNFCRISKYRLDELIGQDHRIINSGYHPAAYIRTLWKTIAHGNIWRGEFCNKAKDGTLYWVDTTIIPFVNEKGKPYQYLSIRIDITQKKTAEYLLKVSEENYRTIFFKSPFPKWIYDLETLRFLDINETALKHYGYSRDEFLRLTILDIRPPEDADALLKDIARITEDPGNRNGTWRHLKKNGEIIMVETTAHPIEYNGRKARLVIAIDITKKLKAEEELRRSEMMLKEAQGIAHLGSWEIDFTESNHIWSDELFRILGIDKAESAPSIELFISFIHPDDQAAAREIIFDALRNYTQSRIGFRFIRKNGAIRFGLIEWRFEFDDKGAPLRLYGILQDITEQKAAEDKLKKMERKIQEQRIQEQKKIARAIIKAQEKERNYLGQELHDNVNQILAGTKMFLGSAAKKNTEVKELIRYPLELIDTAIEEIRTLCQRLATPVKNIDLKEMVDELLRSLLDGPDIKTIFTFNIPAESIQDELKLNIYRIIQEQVNNIIKHAEAKNITISLTHTTGSTRVIISDDGKGFDVNKKRKGVGISNMINRAESFNGQVDIKSETGKGTRITITIPD